MRIWILFVLAGLGVGSLMTGCTPQEAAPVEVTAVRTEPAVEPEAGDGHTGTANRVIRGDVLLSDFKPFLRSLAELDGHKAWTEARIQAGFDAVNELAVGEIIDGGLHLDIGERHIDVTLRLQRVGEDRVLVIFGEVPPIAIPEIQSRLDKHSADR